MYLIGPTFKGKHTNAQAGQDPFKGWLRSGIKMCKDLAKQNREARKLEATKELEGAMLAKIRQDLGLTEATADAEKKAKRRKSLVTNEMPSDVESEDEEDFQIE